MESVKNAHYFANRWSSDQQEMVTANILADFGIKSKAFGTVAVDHADDYSHFIHTFKVKEHIEDVLLHKRTIVKVYERFQTIFKSVTMDAIKKHDDSKVNSFVELLGYTDRFVWDNDSPHWRVALDHHYRK